MKSGKKVGRRDFLRLSAVAAGGAVVVACGGSTAPSGNAPTAASGSAPTAASGGAPTAPPSGPGPTVGPVATREGSGTVKATAIPPSAKFSESPTLAARVQAGDLPALADRLPKNPYVVPHKWLKPGKYGGTMQMGGQGTDEFGTSGFVQESMYGHSPLRYLEDGLKIGPGLAESWGPNADQTEWTFKFREGLKWSDGEPWTTADIMYWWEDMVLNEEHPETPPDEARSGKNTLAKFTATDDVTLTITFDAPAPLTADRIAMWVNRRIGPAWMEPKHYMMKFHPKYNKALAGKKDWFNNHDLKREFGRIPGTPTMTGWMLKAYKTGQFSQWERNPYYYAVDREGNQLPYIDNINFTPYQDKEVMKLQFQEGKVDFVNGGHTPLDLTDVAGLQSSKGRSKLEVRFWDSGSGTGSIYFFSYDYFEPKMRALIRNPKFRKAMSHAINRDEIQKVVYFTTGEKTTGTMSPKAIEYSVNDEGKKVYAQWRDSAIKYDPAMAKALLDEIGAVDKNGDGLREMPDGTKLTVTLDYPADTGNEHISKNNVIAKNWKAVGIDAKLNPIPPTSYTAQWLAGKIMSKTAWEVGDGPNHLVYPQWVVPLESSRWAPLEGEMYNVRGTPAEKLQLDLDPYKRTPPRMAPEKGGSVERLWAIYDKSKIETNPMGRHKLVWDMIKIHVEDGPFYFGTVANTPRIILVKQGLMNVPLKTDLAQGGFCNPWIHPVPAVYDPETFYWETPPTS